MSDDWGSAGDSSSKKSGGDDWGSAGDSWGNPSTSSGGNRADDGWGASTSGSGSGSTSKKTTDTGDSWGGGSWGDSGGKSGGDAGGSSWGGSSWGGSGSGGGGGGSDKPRGKGCFKCGQEGHMSRECPSGGDGAGGNRGKGCFKCGQEGHMSRECPSGGGGGGGGNRGKGCFKCGQEGHMSRECPSGGGGSGGGGGRSRACFKCGQEGHMSRDCPGGSGSAGSSGSFAQKKSSDDWGSGGWGESPAQKKGKFDFDNDGGSSQKKGGDDWGGESSTSSNKGGDDGWGSGGGGSSSSPAKKQNTGDDWGSGGGGGGGWGDSSSSAGQSKSGDSGWSSGGKSSGSRPQGKGCFKCGEEGHMSRECPSGGGGNRGGGARRDSGSFSQAKSSGDDWGSGGGSSWGEPSTSSKKGGDDGWGSGGGGSSSSPAKKQSTGDDWGSDGGGGGWGDSSSGQKSGGGGSDWSGGGKSSGGGSRGKCFKCGEEGHMSRECPSGGGGGGGKGCFKCNQEGHQAKDCTVPQLDADGKPRPPLYKPPDLDKNDKSLYETVETGENFGRYDSMPCSVSGTDIPKDPEKYETFEEAFTSETIREGLAATAISKPTPIQKYGMRIVMAGRDLMACAQTGSGKTLAFILPILQDLYSDPKTGSEYGKMPQEPRAVIVSPTRELALQIYREAYKYSGESIVKTQIIYGGTSVAHQRAKLSEGAHILVGTPGRLLDFLKREIYCFSQLKYLVLDEADRMIDSGFVPDIRKMVTHPTMPHKTKRQTLMFSATFPDDVQKVAAEFLKDDYLFLTVGILGAANSDVEQVVLKVEKFSKRNTLLEILGSSKNNDRTMIFVEAKKTADFLASFLSQSSYRATSIHGDRYQHQREEALRDLKSGKFPILVATSVASRGLDIQGVRHVINYDLPKEIDDYVHRIGRTGRVGNKGKATSFYDPAQDSALAEPITKIIKSANQKVPDWLNEEVNGTGSGFGGADFGGVDIRDGVYVDVDAPKAEAGGLSWDNPTSDKPKTETMDSAWDTPAPKPKETEKKPRASLSWDSPPHEPPKEEKQNSPREESKEEKAGPSWESPKKDQKGEPSSACDSAKDKTDQDLGWGDPPMDESKEDARENSKGQTDESLTWSEPKDEKISTSFESPKKQPDLGWGSPTKQSTDIPVEEEREQPKNDFETFPEEQNSDIPMEEKVDVSMEEVKDEAEEEPKDEPKDERPKSPDDQDGAWGEPKSREEKQSSDNFDDEATGSPEHHNTEQEKRDGPEYAPNGKPRVCIRSESEEAVILEDQNSKLSTDQEQQDEQEKSTDQNSDPLMEK